MVMELDICKGDWGLASIQLNSLKVAAYVKFLGAPVKFQEKTNPILTPNGTFPVFRHGKHVLDTFENITDYLKTHNFNADINLTPDQEANALAFAQYLDHKLFPCLQYIWWVDATNSGQEVKTWYSKNIPFPFNYYYPGKFEQAAKDLMESLYGEDYDTKDVHYDIYQTAEKCFGDLSAKLGEKEFFFGSHPCSLDAHVFAYIALILKIPQRNATLLNTLKTHGNLVQFASRISQRYFVAINNEFTGKITNKKAAATAEEEGKTSSQRNRDKIFAVVFASIAMTCYAISKGILQINLKEEFQNSIDYKDFFDAEEDD